MVTNEERAEIAQKLRSIDDEYRNFGKPPGTSSFKFEQAIGLCRIPVTDDSIYSRLADLIEPEPERTCSFHFNHLDANATPWQACSNCHDLFPGVDISLEFAYCPACGAKVVEDED